MPPNASARSWDPKFAAPDLDQKVARSYGMVHEAVADTATVRAVFFIDPKGVVRALLYYPHSLGAQRG